MSDGPTKLAPPEVEPLDDIILGEDEQTAPAPPVRPSHRPSFAPPPVDTEARLDSPMGDDRAAPRRDRSSNRVKAADPAKDTRKRSKMTLRIPDDEISRPQLPATTPVSGVPAVAPITPTPAEAFAAALDDDATAVMPMGIVQPTRIVSVGGPDDTLELPPEDLQARLAAVNLDASARRAAGIDVAQEAGWTPYQPTVADRTASLGDRRDFGAMRGGDLGGERLVTRGDDAAAAAAQAAMRDGRTLIDDGERTFTRGADDVQPFAREDGDERREPSSFPPASEEIPIDTDDEAMTRDTPEDAVTHPRLPVVLDAEEIRVEDGDRVTDPGEVAEVEPEDLVSVESIPIAPPPLRGAKAATSPASAVTATALMAGVTPAAPPVAMPAPLVMPSAGGPASGPTTTTPSSPSGASATPSAKSPSVPPPAPSVPAQTQPQGPVAGTPMARRQQPAGGPFGYMPAALAPPPMNEAAANRKKTRPWWEDLFNDDFIRTMAKVTDADIAREANFIEESLGCEAGATILDLACGTGRHAVELASRGYQVVGFDLSLAMLARASDEAQDRRQKINFVQGDMREMTFEETFDGIFSWNTSFGYFDEEKNAAVIAKVHRALKKGGQFLLDVVNRDYIIRQAPSLAWFEGDGCICMDEMQMDFITSRMKVKRTLMMDDGRTKEIEYSIRAYALHELGKMLHDNGFRVAEVSGRTGTPGVFFGCESPRTLILAEKR